jgi:TonB family protein
MTIGLVLLLSLVLGPHADAARQAPRDTPPPVIENARRERELRATIASGAATKDTYLELAGLASRQNRYPDAIEALRGAAALEPDSAEAQHRVATYCWEYANKGTDLDASTKLKYIGDAIAAEDRALALKPDYRDAMTYKNILLRMRASQIDDPVERARLVAEADALRNRVIEMQRQEQGEKQGEKQQGPEPPPPPFEGFPEAFEQTMARLTPVRVGGNLKQPTKTADVRPVFPADAQAARVQGVVIIEALIDPSGNIANARVLRSIPMLDEAALGAVSRWRFTPTEVNGMPASVIMTVTVNFTLQ